MSELTLLILRIGFLLLLWFFIFGIVYALRSDLFGAPVRRLKSDGAGSGSPVRQPVVAAQPAQQAAAPAPQPAAGPQAADQHSAPPITPSAGALPSAGAFPGAALGGLVGAGAAAAGAAAAGSGSGSHPGGAPGTLVITSGVASGTSIALDEDFVSIGRSSDSTLVIVDEYTSTYHARLARSGDQWILTDLDSTNGTKLDGAKVTKPVPVPPYTPVTIGTTTFELRP